MLLENKQIYVQKIIFAFAHQPCFQSFFNPVNFPLKECRRELNLVFILDVVDSIAVSVFIDFLISEYHENKSKNKLMVRQAGLSKM